MVFKTRLSSNKTPQDIKLIDYGGSSHLLRLPKDMATKEYSLLEIAVENSVEIAHSCGGMGTCGTCRVHLTVSEGEWPEQSEVELEMASERKFDRSERLSCQLTIPLVACKWVARAIGDPVNPKRLDEL